MECPRCSGSKPTPVSTHRQNRKFRCEQCGLIFSIDHYEWEYELYHPNICGRCKQDKLSILREYFVCYHVTTEDRLKSILKHGLVPNSKPNWFTSRTPYVMLSLYPYWGLYDNPVLLEIKDPAIIPEYFDDAEGLRWDKVVEPQFIQAAVSFQLLKSNWQNISNKPLGNEVESDIELERIRL